VTTTAPLPSPWVKPTVTVEVAGTYLGLGRSASYAAARSGDLATIRVNGRLRVPTAWLHEVLRLPLPSRPELENSQGGP